MRWFKSNWNLPVSIIPIITSLPDIRLLYFGLALMPDSAVKKSQERVVWSSRTESGKMDTISLWPAFTIPIKCIQNSVQLSIIKNKNQNFNTKIKSTKFCFFFFFFSSITHLLLNLYFIVLIFLNLCKKRFISLIVG